MSTTLTTESFDSWELPEAPVPTGRERRWLELRMDRGKRHRFTEVVLVTPGLAVAMLEYNNGNRPLVKSQIAIHADRLRRGDFILTHQGISFSKVGILNDGQHRLSAIIDANLPGYIQITFGAEREEFGVIDQSRKRSACDILSILGESYSASRASVAKMLFQIENKLAYNPDPQLVADYAIELRGSIMDKALNIAQSAACSVCAPTPIAVAYYKIATLTNKPQDKIDAFWLGFHTGEQLTGARLKLREWLREKRPATSNSASVNCQRTAAIIRAWNSFLLGKRTFNTVWNHTIKLPDVD